MKRYTILILGASTMQLPAIRSARRMGWTVVVADQNPDAPGASLGDVFLPVDISNCDLVLQAAEHSGIDGFDGVFTAGTDFSATVAYVAEHLDLPGIPYKVALNASDKARMRSVFLEHQLPSPEFRTVSSVTQATRVLVDLTLPLVVKPVDNMGARGVRRVENSLQLEEAVHDALEFSRTSKAIIESYIEGPEFSLDALVYRGRIELCGIADREIRYPPYFVEIGHTMPSNKADADKAAVIDLFFAGIRALGIENGAAKGDIKLGSTGPVIGEIAARLSGGYMSGWTYPLSSGVDITTAALRIAVGLDPGDLEPRIANISAERAFYSIPGTIESVIGFPDAPEAPLSEAFLRIDDDDDVDFPQNNVQKCGNIIATAVDRETAIIAADAACRNILLRLKPGTRRTQGFLFDATHPWVPDAYCIGDETNRNALAVMPEKIERDAECVEDITIYPLPSIGNETATDWFGRSLAESMETVLELTGVEAGLTGRIVVGSLFWRAMIRGGVQGAIWVIDTIRLERG